jgi:hypothetical protein
MEVNKVPKFIFIIPYRDRESQKIWFTKNIKRLATILPYFEVYFIHQNDKRIFNRGAMKNLGFLFIKQKYPNDYKNISLIFHDIDTFPAKHILLNYITHHKIVKHYYGFTHTLGGIISIKGRNFEGINGFPNYWGWGFEDNVLQNRCLKMKFKIDRDQFFHINDNNIHHFQDERFKLFNSKNIDRVNNDIYNYGITNLKNYNFNCELLHDNYIFMVHIDNFNCEYNPATETFRTHDLTKGNVIMKTYKQPIMKMNFKNL